MTVTARKRPATSSKTQDQTGSAPHQVATQGRTRKELYAAGKAAARSQSGTCPACAWKAP
jgi:hypothetical protein